MLHNQNVLRLQHKLKYSITVIYCCVCVCVCVCTQPHSIPCGPMDCSPPGSSLSVGFPRQEYQSGLPFSSPGDLPNPRIKFMSLALLAASLPLSHLPSSGLLSLYIYLFQALYINEILQNMSSMSGFFQLSCFGNTSMLQHVSVLHFF